MAIKGSCLCGKVTFEINKATGPFEICHCNRCRKSSGSNGLAAVGVNTTDYNFLTGADYIRRFAAPILDAPPAYQVNFCSKCGSPRRATTLFANGAATTAARRRAMSA